MTTVAWALLGVVLIGAVIVVALAVALAFALALARVDDWPLGPKDGAS